MEHVKYVCPECGYESEDAGFCPDCEVALVASCPVCGNPIVGEQVKLVTAEDLL
jgi:predicted amidophosphoribosyltransferase